MNKYLFIVTLSLVHLIPKSEGWILSRPEHTLNALPSEPNLESPLLIKLFQYTSYIFHYQRECDCRKAKVIETNEECEKMCLENHIRTKRSAKPENRPKPCLKVALCIGEKGPCLMCIIDGRKNVIKINSFKVKLNEFVFAFRIIKNLYYYCFLYILCTFFSHIVNKTRLIFTNNTI